MNTAINYDAHRATPDARYGYQVFTIGSFSFTRDEYFVRVSYPKGTYVSDVGLFLRAMMRDVASYPSRFGILMSMVTTSGSRVRTSVKASYPSRASPTTRMSG